MSKSEHECTLAIPTTLERLHDIVPCLTSFLSLSFVTKAVISIQTGDLDIEPSKIPLTAKLRILGGVLDKEVTFITCKGCNIAFNRQNLLDKMDTVWTLMVDDDVMAISDRPRLMWGNKSGYEGVSAIVYMAGQMQTADHLGHPMTHGQFDRIALFKTLALQMRGGFLPTQNTPDAHRRSYGEDVLASRRLAIKDMSVLVGVEGLSKTTWDPSRGGPGAELITQQHKQPEPTEKA